MSIPGRTGRRAGTTMRRASARRRSRIAFVFSGGGSLGALQVGSLLALFDHGIRPDMVVGTSAGALNATLIAFDPTPNGVRRLENLWRKMVDEDLFPGGRFKTSWTRLLRRGQSIFENNRLASLIDQELWPDATFEEAVLPLGIVATNLESGEEALFTSGPIRAPLLASSAMPSIFPPVEIGGERYIDGGVSNNVPIAPAAELGARTIYVMNSTSHQNQRRPLVRPMDHLLHAFTLARSRRFSLDVERYSDKVELVILPSVDVGFFVPFASMEWTDKLIQESYEATSALLDARAPTRRSAARAR